MNRKALSKAFKLSLLATIAALVFFALEICQNENRLEKMRTILCGE